MSDSYDLQRFLEAQEPIFDHVLVELRAGYKERHWMWFVFPQLQGLGSSSMARRYAISSLAEAQAYLAHPILGGRLIECTELVNRVPNKSAEQIFGPVDAMKLRSSMTLFKEAAGPDSVFAEALRIYFGGEADPVTVANLASMDAQQ